MSHRRRGTALGAAIAMLVIVATVVATLSVAFAAEARRTRFAVVGPQQRLLLLAATDAARQQLAAQGPAARTVTLPTPVADAKVILEFLPAADSATARVMVRCLGQRVPASEQLTFTRQPAGWTLTAATLHQSQ